MSDIESAARLIAGGSASTEYHVNVVKASAERLVGNASDAANLRRIILHSRVVEIRNNRTEQS